MFQSLILVVREHASTKASVGPFAQCYAKLFLQLAVHSTQQMNALLSVNCALACGLHRLLGDRFLATLVQVLYQAFLECHPVAAGTKPTSEGLNLDEAKDRLKNLLNCLLHFFLF